MDGATAVEIRRRSALESTRTDPPEGFPKLPDIPLGRYTDPAFHRAEIDRVFRRTWLFAGHTSQFPEPGSYRVLDLPFAPVIVARGNDGELRGFLNACRHRGAPVVRDQEGTARLLVCQFHSWSYDLDGNLTRVPEERDFVGLDKAERGLGRVRVETWGGLVFVNLDPDAPPLLEWLGSLADRYTELAAAPLRHIHSASHEISCNWKVAVEAFLETYHIRTVHKDTGAQVSDTSGNVIVLHPGGHASQHVPYRDDVLADGGSDIYQLMFPADLPLVECTTDLYKTMTVVFNAFPNFVSPVDPGGFPVLLFWPLGIDRTRMDLHFYGVDWGDGARPAGWDTKLLGFDLIFGEDRINLAPMQRSIEAAAHGGIPLSFQERALWQLHVELDRQLGDAVPDALRVPDLLEDLVEQ